MDPHVAVALTQPAATAYLGWFVHARLRAGETVFVGRGAGNIGTAAIQMASRAGARVSASALPDDHEYCRSAGAEMVFDYRDTALAEKVAAQSPTGLDVIWDTSGHHDFALVAGAGAVGARIIITAVAGADSSVPSRNLYTHDVALLCFVISRATVTDLASTARLINQLLVEDQLAARIADQLPLSDARVAHERVENGNVHGRLLLNV